MKKWVRFFFLSFFSHKISKEASKREYTNFLLGLILALIFVWASYVGGDMLPFGLHYKNSPDLVATAHAVFANSDVDKRIVAQVEDGGLKLKKHDGEYTDELLINTFENPVDKEIYSVNGYNVIVDSRSADALAEVKAYCVSSDETHMVISYEDYLSLSEVKRLNFDFKLEYTGKELVLNDQLVEGYKAYLMESGEENKESVLKLQEDLASQAITEDEYNRSVYQLYFTSYYPEITEYESSSKIPLLRNYYYHKYISLGAYNYLFVFDDYMAGSFKTKANVAVSFYGFYSEMENGVLISDDLIQAKANAAVDSFIKKAYRSIAPLNMYSNAMNVLSLIPFIALMPLVVTLLAYSILKLRGVESIATFGSMFKILGSYVWFSGLVSAVIAFGISFFVQQSMVIALPLVFFFITLAVRSIIFAVTESGLYTKQLQQQETVMTEA